MFINPPTFLNAPTVAMLPKSVGSVPNLSIIFSRMFRNVVPLSISDLIKSLFMTVFDNDSNEVLKVLICQFVN